MVRMAEWRDWLFDDTVTTSPEAAETLRVSRWSANRLARDRLIDGRHEYGFGALRFFDIASLDALKTDRLAIGEGFQPDPQAIRRRRAHAERCKRYQRARRAPQGCRPGPDDA